MTAYEWLIGAWTIFLVYCIGFYYAVVEFFRDRFSNPNQSYMEVAGKNSHKLMLMADFGMRESNAIGNSREALTETETDIHLFSRISTAIE
ncbi:hypothetical protein Tcan_07968 [Toxocara canis]|uniref:Uncharacterized protein n=1 Tax=Toxocara canis TaxID=6265 RepID=A0A0B2VC42_TOXCA|nr:hypothetical protein Tcan_07968 [Toxocara canis]